MDTYIALIAALSLYLAYGKKNSTKTNAEIRYTEPIPGA